MNKNIKFSAILVFITTAMFLLSSFKPVTIDTKDLIGAWGYGTPENRTVMITTDKIFSVATYDLPGKNLSALMVAPGALMATSLLKIEWNSKDSLQVGTEITEDIQITNGRLAVKQTNVSWDRLDDGKPGELMGAWIITGSFNKDSVSKRSSPFYPRRTMKLLSGKYFHWIAYNVATKTFMNAGGGTYSTINGKYTENIEFFTKTAESVGKTLAFDYSFVNGDWRHKGEKSTGGAMDECWSKRETLEK